MDVHLGGGQQRRTAYHTPENFRPNPYRQERHIHGHCVIILFIKCHTVRCCMEAWITFDTSVRIIPEGSPAAFNPNTIMYRGMASFRSMTYVDPLSFWMTSSRVSAAMHSYRIFFLVVTAPSRLSLVCLA
jgi:hypothetical protein